MITIQNLVSIHFEFDDPMEEDLDTLNRILGDYELDTLEIKDRQGYTAVIESGGKLIHRYYGLRSGTLVGTLAEKGEGFRFRLQTELQDLPDAMDSDAYHEHWCAANPDRVMRLLICADWNNLRSYVVAHHQRVD